MYGSEQPVRRGKSDHGEHLCGRLSPARKGKVVEHILDVQSLFYRWPHPVPWFGTGSDRPFCQSPCSPLLTSPTPAEFAEENCRLLRLAYTSKTSVKCHARPFTFRLVGWPRARPRHVVALVNVTSPKSLVSACTVTPGLWYTATMKPCEVEADWICHQHLTPLSIKAKSRSQASDHESSAYTIPQSTSDI